MEEKIVTNVKEKMEAKERGSEVYIYYLGSQTIVTTRKLSYEEQREIIKGCMTR